MDLPGGGVRSQQERVVTAAFRCNEVGILHIACRVPDREVEQLEVVLVALDLARAKNLETHLAKDAVQFPQGLRIGVQTSQRESPTGQGDIQPFLRQ